MRCDRSPLVRLMASCDRLEGMLTWPTDATGRRLLLDRGAPQPAVDRGLWISHVAHRRRRSPDDREALVGHYLPHARRLAARFYRRGESRDDLEQVAVEGLLLAIDRFDPDRSLPFLAFANPTIVGILKRHFRDAGWGLRVPRRIHEVTGPLREVRDLLAHDLGRVATDEEVADFAGLTAAQVREVARANDVRAVASLDAPAGDGVSPGDLVGREDRAITGVEDRLAIERAVALLAPDARELLGLYFEDNLTQSEIAARQGCSQMQVSRLLDRALAQLRSHLPDG